MPAEALSAAPGRGAADKASAREQPQRPRAGILLPGGGAESQQVAYAVARLGWRDDQTRRSVREPGPNGEPQSFLLLPVQASA